MSAPIAEIPPPAPRRVPNQPPFSLTAFVIIGLILGVLSVVFYTPKIPEISAATERALMVGLVVVFYFAPLLLLWRGLNWARRLMIGLSALGFAMRIANSLLPAEPVVTSPIENFLDALSLPYDVALIVFLLTPAMRRHFKGTPVP